MDNNAVVLPVLEHYTRQFEPWQRWRAVHWLFASCGLVSDDVNGCMFHDELCGFPEAFGKIDFKMEDLSSNLKEVRYYMAVADKFLSLVDEGGFSDALVWDPLPRVIDPQRFRAGGVHSKSAKKALEAA